jgi:hypothetical protein
MPFGKRLTFSALLQAIVHLLALAIFGWQVLGAAVTASSETAPALLGPIALFTNGGTGQQRKDSTSITYVGYGIA